MTGLRATIQTEKMLWWTSSSFLSSVVVAKVCFEFKQVLSWRARRGLFRYTVKRLHKAALLEDGNFWPENY